MLGKVLYLCALITISSATIYETVLRSGLSYFTPDEELQVEIPNRQCTGRLPLEQIACISILGLTAPDVLEVKVGDNSGNPTIEISKDLDIVDIKRSGDCTGSVVVVVKKHCPIIRGNKQVKRDASHENPAKPLRVAKPIMSRAL